MILNELAAAWRADADLLEKYGYTAGAMICRQHADALERARNLAAHEILDLATAARESGYSADRLRHMIAEGRILNVGKKGAPRILRAHLPIKVSRRPRHSAFNAEEAAPQIVAGFRAKSRAP